MVCITLTNVFHYRDIEGMVVAAQCWCILSLQESDVAEGLAMLKGLKFAKDMLFLKLIVESDSSNVITSISETQHQQSYLGSIAEDYNSFASSFHSLDFYHIHREVHKLITVILQD